MYPDSAGMSVDYLNGSFFLQLCNNSSLKCLEVNMEWHSFILVRRNDWQAVPWLLQTGFSLLFCENSDNHKKLV